jgi:SAM-dependent methyltransferase
MIKSESSLMRLFKKLKLDSIAWSLRRIYCPVKKSDLVLEVGSGGNPYFRANVLCDAYLETQERFFVPLICDRPTIIAPAENLPFKDGAFDFVIASHVLEHSADPEKFLSELQRVARAGYIEVPDAFMERLTHYGFHRLEITDIDGVLEIRKKKNYIQDQEIVGLFRKTKSIFPEWVHKYPFQFHVRYYWSNDTGGIKYKILNPEYRFDWDLLVSENNFNEKFSLVTFLKTKTLSLIRRFFSQNKINQKINVLNLMICNKCKHSDFELKEVYILCNKCLEKYSVYGLKR